MGQSINIKDYGAVGDGNTDDTAAIQNAIDACPSGMGTIYFPAGVYKVTSTITISKDRIHLVGEGVWTTAVKFAPTVDDTCFEFNKNGSVLFQCSIQGMALYVSETETYEKIAIHLVDCSMFCMDNIATYQWSGGESGSIALKVNGREHGWFRNLNFSADRPIVIGPNPNVTISMDHHCFCNCYLIARTDSYPCVEIEDEANLTQVTFDGTQSWCLGTHGLYWDCPSNVLVSNGLSLNNVRWEQSNHENGYLVYIDHGCGLQNLVIRGCYGSVNMNGYYLRTIDGVTIADTWYVSTTREGINVDSTVYGLRLQNVFWQNGSTGTVTGQRLLWSTPKRFGNQQATYNDALFESTNRSYRPVLSNNAEASEALTVANDGTADLTPYGSDGILFIAGSNHTCAQFQLKGLAHATVVLLDPNTAYSTTAGTAGKVNVYWSSANSRYELENKSGASIDFRFRLIGT